jgi:hypothetical protein
VAAFTGLGGSFPVDWVATFTGIRRQYLKKRKSAPKRIGIGYKLTSRSENWEREGIKIANKKIIKK